MNSVLKYHERKLCKSYLHLAIQLFPYVFPSAPHTGTLFFLHLHLLEGRRDPGFLLGFLLFLAFFQIFLHCFLQLYSQSLVSRISISISQCISLSELEVLSNMGLAVIPNYETYFTFDKKELALIYMYIYLLIVDVSIEVSSKNILLKNRKSKLPCMKNLYNCIISSS